eukprot:m.990821 g.990821  ORF g.990821 m.990821 type:complete len:292 (-) comp24001_c0_seq29:1738-2613(-)
MARNEEKAQSMLARFREAKKLELEGEAARRPYLATECDTVKECERWRHQIVREIAKGVAQIQNAGLGEFRIRDLNDEINKKMREKGHWEDRILELGGPDYRKTGPKMLDHEGKEVPGNRGYKYFGAARDLPGVRELFAVDTSSSKSNKTRGDLMKKIDADYYGYRDEDDGILLPLEEAAEAKARAQAEEEWRAARASAGLDATLTSAESRGAADGEEDDDMEFYQGEDTELDDNADGMAVDDGEEMLHVEVPTQKDIEQLLLQRRKQILLEQYTSEGMRNEEKETRELANR